MTILLVLTCICAFVSGFLYIRCRMELRSLYRQLEEIEDGSQIELAVNSRQRPVLALCGILNTILSRKDRRHIQYERAEKRLKQNVAGLAHDIRTPLTGAIGYTQLAQECTDAAKRARYLQTVESRLAELEDMLEEMFLYTKVTSEDFQLSVRKVPLLPLLGDCLLSQYTKFEKAGFSPEVSFSSEGACVWADEDALRRIFLNLIQNALIHGEGGLTILQRADGMIFENPVSEDSRPNTGHMFDIFYKNDPARGKGSSGLGLFIVRELMRKMGGEAMAETAGNLLRIRLVFRK